MAQTPNNITPAVDFDAYIAHWMKDFTGREWVFQRLEAWLQRPSATGRFLLVGGPGTGKTTLAARLVQMSDGTAASETYPHLRPGWLTYAHFCQSTAVATLHPLQF